MLISSFLTSFRSRRSVYLDRGFTLIEILIVVGIMAILSAILVGYSHQNGQQIILASTISKVEALVSRAKFTSVQTFFDDPAGLICAYGIWIIDEDDEDGERLFVFRVKRDELEKCLSLNDGYKDLNLSDENVDPLEGDVNNLYFKQDGVDLSASFEYVVFIPPEPTTLIDGDSDNSSGTITIKVGDLNPADITIRDNGQIEVQ